MSIEELAKYLSVAEKTIRKWVLNENIPYRKIQKVIRFRLSEIERWIESGGKLPLLNDEVGEGAAGADGAGLVAGSGGETCAALEAGSDSETCAALSDGAARGAGSDRETCAGCGLFPDDKKNGSAVEAPAVEAPAVEAPAVEASAVGGKE